MPNDVARALVFGNRRVLPSIRKEKEGGVSLTFWLTKEPMKEGEVVADDTPKMMAPPVYNALYFKDTVGIDALISWLQVAKRGFADGT